MKQHPFPTHALQRFYRDQEGRSAIGFTFVVAILSLVAVGSVTFAMTDGDPVGAYERMTMRMYWTARCKENIPGACQVAKIQW